MANWRPGGWHRPGIAFVGKTARTAAHLKSHGLEGLFVTCANAACCTRQHSLFDALVLADDVRFPSLAQRRFVCKRCGVRTVNMSPDWRAHKAVGHSSVRSRAPCGALLSVRLHSFFNRWRRLLEICRNHGRGRLDACIQRQEPRLFSDSGNLGRVLDVDDEDGGAPAAVGDEIGGFRLLVFEVQITLRPFFFTAALPASTGNEILTKNRMTVSSPSRFPRMRRWIIRHSSSNQRTRLCPIGHRASMRKITRTAHNRAPEKPRPRRSACKC